MFGPFSHTGQTKARTNDEKLSHVDPPLAAALKRMNAVHYRLKQWEIHEDVAQILADRNDIKLTNKSWVPQWVNLDGYQFRLERITKSREFIDESVTVTAFDYAWMVTPTIPARTKE